jgi:UPF0176 protein
VSLLVVAFYEFAAVAEPAALQARLLAVCQDLKLFGTVLVAPEGINGTLAGPDAGVRRFVEVLRNLGFGRAECKFSPAGEAQFDRLKVKLKREIITFGRVMGPDDRTGVYVAAGDWNALLDDPDVLVIDARKSFEFEMGTFAGAVDSGTDHFTAFKAFVETLPAAAKGRKIAMFCTGGIRCVKASAFMLDLGFRNVFQLQGGILRYLEEVPAESSKWRGACFVFDRRGALGQGLAVETGEVP